MIYHKVGVVTFPILHFHFSDSLCVCVCVYFDFEPLMYDNLFSLEGDIICYFTLFSNINSVIQPMPVNIQHGLLICRSCLGLLDNNCTYDKKEVYISRASKRNVVRRNKTTLRPGDRRRLPSKLIFYVKTYIPN